MSGEQSLFQLITPLIMATFSIGFFVVYYYQKKLTSTFWLGLSYLSGALGFTISFYRHLFDYITASYITNTFFMAAALFFVYALCVRYKQKYPTKTVLAISIMTLVAMTYYLIIEPDITMRSIIINFAVMLLFLAGAWSIRKQQQQLVDKILFFLVVIGGLQAGVRTSLIISFVDETLTIANYQASTFALALQFTSAFLSLALAVCLFIALGMDLVKNLNRDAGIDPLSTLLNRRGFALKTETFMKLHNRGKLPISLIVCDIDHFKKINDTYGHSKGDEVIKDMGKMLISNKRESDVAARIGGEEFCILLWNTDIEGARLFAEATRTLFEQQHRNRFEDGHNITSSFGVSQIIENEHYESFFDRADKALYQAKNSGRNRVCISSAFKNDIKMSA